MLGTLLLIAVAGGLGSMTRYLVSQIGHRMVDDGAPPATLAVNLAGCFLIGFLAPALAGPWSGIREDIRTAILVGFLGGLTTFSAFGLETFHMLDRGHWGRAASFAGVQLVAGVLAVLAGAVLAHRWLEI